MEESEGPSFFDTYENPYRDKLSIFPNHSVDFTTPEAQAAIAKGLKEVKEVEENIEQKTKIGAEVIDIVSKQLPDTDEVLAAAS